MFCTYAQRLNYQLLVNNFSSSRLWFVFDRVRHWHKQGLEYPLTCFNINSHFLSTDTVFSRPSGWRDCSGWRGPPKAAKLGKIWGYFSRWMGASFVLRDSATPLKGRGLTVLLWVRRDTGPAQGERMHFQFNWAVYTLYSWTFFNKFRCIQCTVVWLHRAQAVQPYCITAQLN